VSRTGRRPGDQDTRAEVLAAARHRFAADGFDNATIRAIAGDAGVDPALVHHYFGSKRDLFRTAVAFPVQAEEVIEAVGTGTPRQQATALARVFFSVWEDPATRPQMLSVLRSAMTHDDAARVLRQFVGTELLGPVARRTGTDPDDLAVSLAAAQMVGIAVMRYVVGVEPLASADTDEVVARVAPALEHHLFGN
jgi:AcrR family transcriptional regulator